VKNIINSLQSPVGTIFENLKFLKVFEIEYDERYIFKELI